MASSQHLRNFNDMLEGLRVVTGSLQALKSGSAMHTDLQGVIERNANHMASHYKRHLKAIDIPDPDRLRLEKLCQSLSSTHKAQKSVMTIIVGIMQHAHQEEPTRFVEQQNNIRIWQTMESEGIASEKIHALLIGILLQRGPMLSATGLNTLVETTRRRDEVETEPQLQSTPETSVVTTSLDQPANSVGTTPATSLLTIVPGVTAPAPTETASSLRAQRRAEAGRKLSNASPMRVRCVYINDQTFQEVSVTLVYRDATNDNVAPNGLYDLSPYLMPDSDPGIRINTRTIQSPITYSRSTSEIRLPHVSDSVVVQTKNNGDLEEFLRRFKSLNPDIDARTESRSVDGEPASEPANDPANANLHSESDESEGYAEGYVQPKKRKTNPPRRARPTWSLEEFPG
ncbi:MAG: hypothetical protein LQ346_006174 [Caloplaca aetnensis]|nr:MAG: hypothetical protein LQ346_006174 [Caloplaca aetnensis]